MKRSPLILCRAARCRRPCPAKAGFTLVELLVVIAILSVLLSILVPSLRRAREAARRAVCMAQMRQIVVASFAYANNFDGCLPGSETSRTWDWNTWDWRRDYDGYKMAGMVELFNLDYLDDRRMMLCPSRFDRPTWSPTETYVGRQYWRYGFSSYMWAGSATIPTCHLNPTTWTASIYWVRPSMHDPSYCLMADVVSYEVAEPWEGGWPWMRQNNHYDRDDPGRVPAEGGNVVRADGSAKWLVNDGETWTHTGQYAEHWPDGCIQAQARSGTPGSDVATQYYFTDNRHDLPSGPLRGRFIP